MWFAHLTVAKMAWSFRLYTDTMAWIFPTLIMVICIYKVTLRILNYLLLKIYTMTFSFILRTFLWQSLFSEEGFHFWVYSYVSKMAFLNNVLSPLWERTNLKCKGREAYLMFCWMLQPEEIQKAWGSSFTLCPSLQCCQNLKLGCPH